MPDAAPVTAAILPMCFPSTAAMLASPAEYRKRIDMCGRYAAFLPAEAIVALFQTSGPTPNWAPTWNMAPTRDAPVVRRHPDTGERRLDLLRWGLVPHWAKDPKAVRLSINARAETLAATPMFRDA